MFDELGARALQREQSGCWPTTTGWHARCPSDPAARGDGPGADAAAGGSRSDCAVPCRS